MKKLIFLVATWIVMPFANAQLLHVAALPLVENQVQVGKMTINLPSGQWRVLQGSESRTNVTGGGPSQGGGVERKYLVRLNEKNQLEAAMFLGATKHSTIVSSWNDAVCQRKDTLWLQELDGNFNFPACLLINHAVPFWTEVPTNDLDRTIFD
jgi:hypothetical protein